MHLILKCGKLDFPSPEFQIFWGQMGIGQHKGPSSIKMNPVIFLTLIFVLAAEIIISELKGVRNKNHLKVIRKEVRQ